MFDVECWMLALHGKGLGGITQLPAAGRSGWLYPKAGCQPSPLTTFGVRGASAVRGVVRDGSSERYFQLRILSLFTPLLAFTFASALPSGPKDQTMAGNRTRSTLPPFSKR